VPAPDFSPGERVFKPAETLYRVMTGLLPLVRIEVGQHHDLGGVR